MRRRHELQGQRCRARDYLIEHSAQSRTIDHVGLHVETYDTAGELIHHHHHPVRFEDQRFTTKEIDAPETVIRMPEEGEPRRTVRAEGRSTMFGEYTSHSFIAVSPGW